MNVVVIPARGGSKRIPRKNIRPFAGLPMIAHSIKAAQESGVCDRLVVSTDDEEIAAVARHYGAETPFQRPQDLANDYAGTMEVVQHAIGELIAQGCHPDYVCCLYATAPFVTGELLRRGLSVLTASGRSYVFPVATFGFPIQRALRIETGGGLAPFYPEYRFTRSQDLEEAYQDTGQFYWGKTGAWQAGDMLYSPAAAPILVPRHLVQDIDTPEDWARAEWLYQAWQNTTKEETQP